MFSRSESSSRSVVVGGLVSTKTVSLAGKGCVARLFARGTNSIRSRSMHVVDRKEDMGSDEPTGAGRGVGVSVSDGRDAMLRNWIANGRFF